MRQKAGPQKAAAEQVIKDIRRVTRKHHSAEEKIRVVLEGLRGDACGSAWNKAPVFGVIGVQTGV